jgi:rhodanese-related sulfurtransferase
VTQQEKSRRSGGSSTARTIDEILARARSGLDRLSPDAAAAALDDGAVLVDIRPVAQREREGEVPGSLVVERNVLEWRFDPSNAARLPIADDHLRVVVLCSEGYTSSLAAASLQELGVHLATDVVGGLAAWRQAGLPVAPGGRLDRAEIAPGVLQLGKGPTPDPPSDPVGDARDVRTTPVSTRLSALSGAGAGAFVVEKGGGGGGVIDGDGEGGVVGQVEA